MARPTALPRGAPPSLLLVAAIIALGAGCSDEPGAGGTGGTGADGGAGGGGAATPTECPAGQALDDDGSCQQAGVPPELCPGGFTPNGRGGCTPVLPDAPCDPGQLALPGETSCRPVGSCGAAPWGDIPTEPDTQHVDAAYTGGASDGSAAHPWTDVQSAIDAAAADAVVAVAAGTYAGNLAIVHQPVRLWGRCPELVEIATYDLYGVHIDRASSTEVHGLAFTGPAMAVLVSDADDVLVDQVWVYQAIELAMMVRHDVDPAGLTLQNSLIEGGEEGGILSDGGWLTLRRSVIRDRVASDLFTGRGVDLLPGLDGTPAAAEIVDSVVQATEETGIVAFGADLTVLRSVVLDTQPRAADGRIGVGIQLQNTDVPATLQLEGSTIVGNHTGGVTVLDSSATVSLSTIDDSQPQPADGGFGDGVTVLASDVDGATVILDRCAVAQAARAGVTSFSATATIGGSALSCNPIDLDGEVVAGPFTFQDNGLNACFCGDQVIECQVRSTNLLPPSAL